MSEIEKMYENVGIEPKKCSECDNNMDCGFGKDCYPSFTVEKQIEIIKWISDFADFGTFSIDHDKSKSEYGIAFCVNDDGYYFVDKIFEECIAKAVKNLWLSLSEEEKQQVKGILE